MDWTLTELRYLLAVVDARSFTVAAGELGVSQAAVSRAVGKLERRLGEGLLVRTPRACEPTPLGVQLTAQARRVLAEV
ncbi:LysR family transcriptional regulator [Pseudonocardia lutea]|uniref:LysR family transcriptional regulator n=1 Tax=Pseudonocardia lutea TaxID=2172015 RepID=A0ABW1IGV2_9PSEU